MSTWDLYYLASWYFGSVADGSLDANSPTEVGTLIALSALIIQLFAMYRSHRDMFCQGTGRDRLGHHEATKLFATPEARESAIGSIASASFLIGVLSYIVLIGYLPLTMSDFLRQLMGSPATAAIFLALLCSVYALCSNLR